MMAETPQSPGDETTSQHQPQPDAPAPQGGRDALGAEPGVDPDVARAFIRAEAEDDDGYDPYSDRPSQTPLWEPDPWD